MAAKRPLKMQAAWSPVKERLSDYDNASLIALLHKFYVTTCCDCRYAKVPQKD
jgi:hypothetical protein